MPSSTTDPSPHRRRLLDSLAARTTSIGILGLGYVGLPLARTLHDGGLRILGFDIDSAKIDCLVRGVSYLDPAGDDPREAELAVSDRFEPTSDMERLGEPDVVIVCLPTPLGPHNEPVLDYVVGAGRDIGRALRPGQLVILESTTYPGTTRREFWEAILAGSGDSSLRLGHEVFVAYSPEREDPGRRSHSTATIPKLVGGLDDVSAELAAAVYRCGVAEVVVVDSAEIAEAAKLLENIYRAVNIALVNEMKMVLTDLDIDIWKVVEAAATKPFGFMPFYPGPGLGGHCIPIDPFYLTWRAREVGQRTRFIELAGELNRSMPRYVVDRVAEALNDHGQPVRGANVLVLGLAYKPNVADTRESPAYELMELLLERGAEVSYHDPHVPNALPVRRHDFGLKSLDLTEERVADADVVLIATHHDAVDYGLVARSARLVVDTRNAMDPYADQLGPRLVKA